MKKYFVDTNVILRFLLQDNHLQCEEADKAFKKAKDGEIEIIICQSIIFEIAYVLEKYYETEKEEIVNMLGKIMNVPYLEIENRSEFLKAILKFNSSNIGLIDCFLAVKAQLANAEVLSFDKDLKKHEEEKK